MTCVVETDTYVDIDYLGPYAESGQFLAICGLSGSGKSTLLFNTIRAYPTDVTFIERTTTRSVRKDDNMYAKEIFHISDREYEERRSADEFFLYRIKSESHKSGLARDSFENKARQFALLGTTFHIESIDKILSCLPMTPAIFISATVEQCLERTSRREKPTIEALAKKKAKLAREKPQFDALIERHQSKPNTRVLQSPLDVGTPEYARFFDEAIGLLRSTGRLLP